MSQTIELLVYFKEDLIRERYQPAIDNNLLDLVFTNNPSFVKTSSSVPGISDHAIVVIDINIIPQHVKQKSRKLFIFSKANWDNIFVDMDQLSYEITSAPPSFTVQNLWDSFKSGIEQSMNRNIPTKVCKNRKSVPWYNRDLKRMVRRNSRLYKYAKKSNQWGSFKAFQKTCKKAFKKAETSHINDVIQKGLTENNHKPFFALCQIPASRQSWCLTVKEDESTSKRQQRKCTASGPISVRLYSNFLTPRRGPDDLYHLLI